MAQLKEDLAAVTNREAELSAQNESLSLSVKEAVERTSEVSVKLEAKVGSISLSIYESLKVHVLFLLLMSLPSNLGSAYGLPGLFVVLSWLKTKSLLFWIGCSSFTC